MIIQILHYHCLLSRRLIFLPLPDSLSILKQQDLRYLWDVQTI